MQAWPQQMCQVVHALFDYGLGLGSLFWCVVWEATLIPVPWKLMASLSKLSACTVMKTPLGSVSGKTISSLAYVSNTVVSMVFSIDISRSYEMQRPSSLNSLTSFLLRVDWYSFIAIYKDSGFSLSVQWPELSELYEYFRLLNCTNWEMDIATLCRDLHGFILDCLPDWPSSKWVKKLQKTLWNGSFLTARLEGTSEGWWRLQWIPS